MADANTDSDWKECMSPGGIKFYHNQKTMQSSWEKPLELMTPIERADASTNWIECRSNDGRMYYYNKVTELSQWTVPEELRLAREHADIIYARSDTRTPDTGPHTSQTSSSPGFTNLPRDFDRHVNLKEN